MEIDEATKKLQVENEKKWVYVVHSDGKKIGTSYVTRRCLTRIDDVKYKIHLNDGIYYEGIILCESDTKSGLKNMVADFEPPYDKNCFKEFPTKSMPRTEFLRQLFKPTDHRTNWKKRLMKLATENLESAELILSSLPKKQTGDLTSNQVNEKQNGESNKVNKPKKIARKRQSKSDSITTLSSSSNESWDSEKKWVYVVHSDGTKIGTSYVTRRCLTRIDDVKYKIHLNDGIYYEGIILCESDTKSGLKNMVADFEPPYDKNCFKEFPTKSMPRTEFLRQFFKPTDHRTNWKKRLMNSATENLESAELILSSLPKKQTGDLTSNQVNEKQNGESNKVNKNTMEIVTQLDNSAQPCNKRQSMILEKLTESDSDESTYTPSQRKRILEMFPYVKQSPKKIARKRQSKSDSITTLSSSSNESWDSDKNKDQEFEKPMNYDKVFKSQIIEKFKEYLDSADNAKNLFQEILKQKESTDHLKQHKQSSGIYSSKKSDIIGRRRLKSRHIFEKQRKKMRGDKFHKNEISFNQLNDKSTNERVQFKITYVYSPVWYTNELKNKFNKKNLTEMEKDFESSVVDYIASTVPFSHYDLSVTVLDGVESSEEEIDDDELEKERIRLRKRFEELKEQYLKSQKAKASLREKLQNLEKPDAYCNSEVQQTMENSLLSKLSEDTSSKKSSENSKKKDPSYNTQIHQIIKKSLPSKSLEKFLELNKALAESLVYQEELKKFYKNIIYRETKVRNCINKIMSHTLATNVGLEFSGTGKKFRGVTKLNYSETQAFYCLHDVLVDKFGLVPELNHLSSQVGQWLSNNSNRQSKQQLKTTT